MRAAILALSLLCPVADVAAQQATDAVAPEAAVARADRRDVPVRASDWMIAAAHPLAAQAGADVLARGGSAADAMVTVQAVLGLVEPQSSGLGGGAFLLWHDAARGDLVTLDGRETAPLAARPTLFQDRDGAPLDFYAAVVGGRSVGVPGVPALMQAAHRRWGRLDWASLFDAPIRLAEQGFAVSPRLAALVAGDAGRLAAHPVTRDYFLPGGIPVQAGAVLRNPDYAQVLRLMAGAGAAPFYTGEIAADIVQAVRTAPGNPGLMSAADLALYRVQARDPVCVTYRAHEVCGMGPPSSGGLAVGQILGLLAPYDLAARGPGDPQAWRLIGDATRLAFADRGRYVADSDFVPVPVGGMLDPAYLAARSALLRGDDALPEVAPGRPRFDHARADGVSQERPSTSHVTIVDAAGNVLSMTSSVENAFGSRVMVRGFLLNNQLTDFSFATQADGVPVANRVEPGKRPRSSMAPTIVRRDGQPVLALGSPGGSRIIPYVAKTLIAVLDWDMNVQQAISLPHLVNRFGPYDIERGTEAEALADPLRALGYEVNLTDLTSGLHGIAWTAEGLEGGADPRREGVVRGGPGADDR